VLLLFLYGLYIKRCRQHHDDIHKRQDMKGLQITFVRVAWSKAISLLGETYTSRLLMQTLFVFLRKARGHSICLPTRQCNVSRTNDDGPLATLIVRE
jgi:hypothetical protein